jgi:glycosyltransferase involved in cell wall biosynthesis
MNILQVSTADRGGGAEGSARALFLAYRQRGHGSWLAVGQKASADPGVFELPRRPLSSWSGRLLQRLAERLRRYGTRQPLAFGVARRLELLADPARRADWYHGVEDFNFPGTARLLDLCPAPPDIVHCHNLHGGYFDLRELPALSHRVPLILNLRDTWLLTGHCGYFIDCQRWRSGCGACPDLQRYPGIRRDATAANWRRKRELFARSRLYVTAPSDWLLGCARDAGLGAVDYRMIPNGIDLNVFRPGDRHAARARLQLAPPTPVVMFAAASRRNVYKDPEGMNAAIRAVAATPRPGPAPVFLCVGTRVPAAGLRHLDVRCVPFLSDPAALADCYRAADVFVHTARAEAFGKTVTEAMACGTPVVATAVGGIAEQFEDGLEGFLTPPGDAGALAAAVSRLLADADLRAALGPRAARRGACFSLERQVAAFLDWYGVISTTRSCCHERNDSGVR